MQTRDARMSALGLHALESGTAGGELVPELDETQGQMASRRRHRRGLAPPGVTLAIDGAGPGYPGSRHAVRDLSAGSLSFWVSCPNVVFRPPEVLSGRLIGRYGEVRVKLVVRSCRRPSDAAAATVVGATFAPVWQHDVPTVRRFVDGALYPTTRAASANVWESYQASGYLELSGKSPADFEHLRAGYTQFVQKVAHHRDVAVALSWPAAERPRATLSHYKPYSRTWLLCHVAKRRDVPAEEGRAGLRDLYLRAFETAQADADARWLLTYVQDAAPSWSHKVHVDVPQRFVKTGQGCLIPFRALEMKVRVSRSSSAASPIVVRPAKDDEAARAVRALCAVRPAPYLDALDLTQDRLDLAPVRARWRAAGLDRERQLLIAWDGETASALAVLETAGPDAHIFGLLDSLRMYPLQPAGLRTFDSLLQAAHVWFAERGRRQFVYMREFADDLQFREHGFRDLGGALLTLLAVERVRASMQRVWELTSPQRAVHAVSSGSSPTEARMEAARRA
jgi:hypothetical protein